MPTLTLCMIVRDEGAALAALLPRLEGGFDQRVAVDTGSRDESPLLLARNGFEVHSEAWPNDFAVARNHSLERATGDWILVLDADEELEPGAIELLRELAAEAPSDLFGYILNFRNYSDDARDLGWQRLSPAEAERWGCAGYYPTQVVRFFRNDPRIRYRGRIHELVEPSIAEAGGRILPARITIHHYLQEHVNSDGRSKSDRYLELQELKLLDHPRDAKAHWELGTLYLSHGRAADACRVLARAWELAPRALEIAVPYATALNEEKSCEQALVILEALPAAARGDPRVEFQMGLALALLERREEACAALERAHAGSPHLPQPLLWLARLSLEADLPRAERHAAELQALAPDYWPGLLLRVAIAALDNRAAEAVEAFQTALARAPRDSDLERANSVGALADLYRRVRAHDPGVAGRLLEAASESAEHALLFADGARLAGAPGDAHRLLTRASGRFPDCKEIQLRAAYQAAQLALARGELQKGAEYLAVVLKREPRHVQALTDLAGLHGNSGRVELAERLLMRALEIDPKNALVRRNLAIAALLSDPPRLAVAREHAAAAKACGHSLGAEVEQRIAEM